MALVDAYDTQTGKKLPYLVPEQHIDHPVLGRRLSRTPSSRQPKPSAIGTSEPSKKPVKKPTTTETPDTGNKE